MSAEIPEGIYFVENVETKRYLFQTGNTIAGKRGDEGGWKDASGFEAPAVVGTDANYYNRAYWRIIPQGGAKFMFENVVTQRYLFQTGDKITGTRGSEGGWKESSGFAAPPTVGTDANYYNRAYWKIIPQGDGKYFIENDVTQRYLFQDGPVISGNRGDEGDWQASSGFEAPPTLGTDANYYNRAYWRVVKQ